MTDPRVNFIDNIASGVDRLGVYQTPLVFSLARIPWESAEERDTFFDTVKQMGIA